MAEYSLAQRLRIARAYTGLSQGQVSRKSGIHNVQLSKLERGITKEITGSTLRALCEALRVGPKYILGMIDDIESDVLPETRVVADANSAPAAQPTPPTKRRPRKAAPVG